jgi:hypothetical protein
MEAICDELLERRLVKFGDLQTKELQTEGKYLPAKNHQAMAVYADQT